MHATKSGDEIEKQFRIHPFYINHHSIQLLVSSAHRVFLSTFNSRPLSFAHCCHHSVSIVRNHVNKGVYMAVVAGLGLQACSRASLLLNPSNSGVLGHIHYAFKLFFNCLHRYSRCCRRYELQHFVVGTHHSKIVQALYSIFLPNSNAQRDLKRCLIGNHM